MSRKAAWGVTVLPLAMAVLAGPASAQDEAATTIVKKSQPPAATRALTPQEPAAEPHNGASQTEGAPANGAVQPAAYPENEIKDELRPSHGTLEDDPVPSSEVVDPNAAEWETDVQSALPPDRPLPIDQSALVDRINAYFNNITNLQGTFEQVDSNNKHSSGRFYVERPGKIRFDYAPPSPLRIVADGHYLAIEDSDLKTIEKYPLKSTPFRILLANEVDLKRDARIVAIDQQDGMVSITLEDRSGEAAGQIKLYFEDGAELALKEWVITDGQGFDTKVTVRDMVAGRKTAADFFKATESFPAFR